MMRCPSRKVYACWCRSTVNGTTVFGGIGSGLRERLAVAAAHDLARHHQLVAAHLPDAPRRCRDRRRSASRPSRRRTRSLRQRASPITSPAMVMSAVERRRLPGEHVGAAIDEALVAREPLVPFHVRRESAAAGTESGVAGSETYVSCPTAAVGAVNESAPFGPEVELGPLGVLGRPRRKLAPGIGACIEHRRLGDRRRRSVLEILPEEARLQRRGSRRRCCGRSGSHRASRRSRRTTGRGTRGRSPGC